MSIELVPYDSAWPDAFAREASQLKEALGDILLDLEHIGSTSIPGLLAKPVIDILAIVGDVGALDTRSQTFEAIGYQIRGSSAFPGVGTSGRTTNSDVELITFTPTRSARMRSPGI